MPFAPHKTGTRPRRELHSVRVAVFLTVLGAHVLGVLYFESPPSSVPELSENGFATSVFFLEDEAQRHSAPVMKVPARSPFAPNSTASKSKRPLPPATSVLSDQENTAPVTIDWAQEAQRAAADQAAQQIAAEAEARHRAGPAPPARQPFRWDYAHTHRVESLPGGGLMVNLSDRCSIVFRFPMLLGACKIGRIESRSDLFAQMHDDSSTHPQ